MSITAEQVATYIAIALPAGAFFTWILRHYLSELKPNGGGSLNDAIKLEILPLIKEIREEVNGVKESVTEVKVAVAKVEGKFEQHIKESVL